ncbi:MAG: hypothetical protein ACI4D3_05075 [Lachnospiraceae bacterium]
MSIPSDEYYDYVHLIEEANKLDEKPGKKALRRIYTDIGSTYGFHDEDYERLYNMRRWIYLD